MNYRTRQGIFNTAYKGIAKQGFVQSKSGGICSYSGTNGRSCAIGHCMPKAARGDVPNKSIVFRTLARPINDVAAAEIGVTIPSQEILAVARIRETDALFAYDLQRTHDSSECGTPPVMEDRLRAFASKHKLTVPLP